MTRTRRLPAIQGSWGILREDLELLWIPVLTFAATIVVGAVLFGVAFVGGEAGILFALLPFCFAATFLTFMGNAAIVAAATARMEGEDPSLDDAFRMAWSARGLIARWAAYAIFIGWLIGMGQALLESLLGWIGKLIGWGAEISWSVITYLVVPVLLFERVQTASGAVTRSKQIATSSWVDQISGRARIWLATGGVALVCGVGGVGILTLERPWSVPLAIVVWLLGVPMPLILGSALSAVFNAALYRYATRRLLPSTFDDLPDPVRR